jgi:DNA-3-methyladenine glycosylase I
MTQLIRCPWCWTDPLYVTYHDEEWWVPVHDDAKLFEFLTLEWAQAGLSWITVLRKRENYRKHFHEWNIEKIAKMTDDELENILLDPGIIRNRLKIYSVRKNAQVALEIQKEYGSLDAYFWSFCDKKTTIHRGNTIYDFPTEDTISKSLSKDLKKRGMTFVGSTIMYAWMQAIGMVNDHIESCYRK